MQGRSLNALLQHGIIVHAWLSHSLSLVSLSSHSRWAGCQCSLLKNKGHTLDKAPVKTYYPCVAFHAALSTLLFSYFFHRRFCPASCIGHSWIWIHHQGGAASVSPLWVSSGWDFRPRVFQGVAHYTARMLAQITAPASACSWFLYTCVCVCVYVSVIRYLVLVSLWALCG